MARFVTIQRDRKHMRGFEGDYKVQEGEFVKIFVNSKNPNGKDRMVASIRLLEGQIVKEITERQDPE